MATTDPDTQAGSSTVPDEAHYMRITSHGQIRTWVEFALDFFKEYPDRSLILHTLPASAVPQPAAAAEAPAPAAPAHPPARARASTLQIPRLLSVAEIMKRAYLARAPGVRAGLHQYNELGTLEALGVDTTAESDAAPGTQTEAERADARTRELREALSGKRHVRIQKTPYMRIVLSVRERPELATAGATHQPPLVKRLTKSARARMNRRKRKEEEGAVGLDADMDAAPAA